MALERCVVDDKCFSEIKVEYLPPDLKSSCVPQQRSEEIHSFKQKGRQRDVDDIEAAQSISKHTQQSATWGGVYNTPVSADRLCMLILLFCLGIVLVVPKGDLQSPTVVEKFGLENSLFSHQLMKLYNIGQRR